MTLLHLLQVLCILDGAYSAMYDDGLCSDNYTIGWPTSTTRSQFSENGSVVVFDAIPSVCFGRVTSFNFKPTTMNGTIQFLVMSRTSDEDTFVITGKHNVDTFNGVGINHHIRFDSTEVLSIRYGDVIGFASVNNDILFEDSSGSTLRVWHANEAKDIASGFVSFSKTFIRSYSLIAEIETISSLGCLEDTVTGREMNVNPGRYNYVSDDFIDCRSVCANNEHTYTAYRLGINACLCGNETKSRSVDMDLCTCPMTTTTSGTMASDMVGQQTIYNVLFNNDDIISSFTVDFEAVEPNLVSSFINPLGVEDGTIPSQQLTASSVYTENHKTDRGRLNTREEGSFMGGWASKINDENQWIQADLGLIFNVTGVMTQGQYEGYGAYCVTQFKVQVAGDANNFEAVKDAAGQVALFKGNLGVYDTVVNMFHNSVEARYIRIHPTAWHQHIIIRFEVLGCTEVSFCIDPLGVEDGTIPFEHLTASTAGNSYREAGCGRLNAVGDDHCFPGAWAPSITDHEEPWIQADLGSLFKVTGLMTQGDPFYNEWMTVFEVHHSVGGDNFRKIMDARVEEAFYGNLDGASIVRNLFYYPVYTRYIRIYPTAWNGRPSVRFEVLGCSELCVDPLGVEDGTIPSDHLEASSEYSSSSGADRGRLNTLSGTPSGMGGAWTAALGDLNQWIQVNLGLLHKVTGVVTQGRNGANKSVTSFEVHYSIDGEHLAKIKNGSGQVVVFSGNWDGDTPVTNIFHNPIYTQFVRVHPLTTLDGVITMRFEVIGCHEPCFDPLGVEDETIIHSDQLTASSVINNFTKADRGRLNTVLEGDLRGAWRSAVNDQHQWIQVDLTHFMKVTGVITQGRPDNEYWVVLFEVLYSVNGDTFEVIRDGRGRAAVFKGNWDKQTAVVNKFHRGVNTRFIQIHPTKWHKQISMRFEVLGCSIGGNGDSNVLRGNTPYTVYANVQNPNSVASYRFNFGDERKYSGDVAIHEHVFLSPGIRSMDFEVRNKMNVTHVEDDIRTIVYDMADTDVSCDSLPGRYNCVFSYLLGSERDVYVTFSDGTTTDFQTSNDIVAYGSEYLSPTTSSESHTQRVRYIKCNDPIRVAGRLMGFEVYTRISGSVQLEIFRPIVSSGYEFCVSSYSYILVGDSCDNQPDVWKKTCSQSTIYNFRKRNCVNSSKHIIFTSPPKVKLQVVKEFTFSLASNGPTYLKVNEEIDVQKGDFIGYIYTGEGELGEELSSSTEFMTTETNLMDGIDAASFGTSDKTDHILRAVVKRRGQALISNSCDVDGDAMCWFNISVAGTSDNFNIFRLIEPQIYNVRITCVGNATTLQNVTLMIEDHPGMDYASYEWNLDNGDIISAASRNLSYSWPYSGRHNISLLAYNNDSQWTENVIIEIFEEISNLDFTDEEYSKWNIVEDGQYVVDLNHAAHLQWSSNGSDVTTTVTIGERETVTLTLPPTSSIHNDSLTVDGVELRNVMASNGGRCRDKLGLELPSMFADIQFEASTTAANSFPHLGRLNNVEGAWTPQDGDNQWIQINLLSIYHIAGIVTQGSGTASTNWVERFFVTYGLSGDVWINGDVEQVKEKNLVGNFDANTSVTNMFSEPIYAKFLRVNVVPQTRTAALRFELLGCRGHSVCLDEMGLRSGEVTNSQITSNAHGFDADLVRIGHDGSGWCLSSSDVTIAVTFQQLNILTGVVFQLETSVDTSMMLKVAHSEDNVNWKYIYINGNLDMMSVNVTANDVSEKWIVFSKEFQTRYLRIELTIHDSVCLRFEMLGCKESRLCRQKVGAVDGKIPADQFTYSDVVNEAFVMVDLLRPYTITGVVTVRDDQGRSIRRFHVEYSLGPANFKTIRDHHGNIEVFNGIDTDDMEIDVYNSFCYPIVCRFLRLVHTETHEAFQPMFTLLGCQGPQTCLDSIEIDFTRTAFSSHNTSYQGALFSSIGWLSQEGDYEPWMLVVLPGRHQVSGIVTTCINPSGYWTYQFYIMYSMNTVTWTSMGQANGSMKMFNCNNTNDPDEVKYDMFDSVINAEFVKINFISDKDSVFLDIALLGCKGTGHLCFTSNQQAVFPVTVQSQNMFSEAAISTSIAYVERINGFKLISSQTPVIWDSSHVLIASKIFSGIYSPFELYINESRYTDAEITPYGNDIFIFSVTMTSDAYKELNPLNVSVRLSNALNTVHDSVLLSVQYEIVDLRVYSLEYVATGESCLIEFDMLRGSHLLCSLDFNNTTTSNFDEYIMERDQQHKISFHHVFTSPGSYDVNVFCANNVSEMNATKTVVVQNKITDEFELKCDPVVGVLSQQAYNITVYYSYSGDAVDIPTDVFANYTITGQVHSNEIIENMIAIVYDEDLLADHTHTFPTWDSYEYNVHLQNEVSTGIRQCYVDVEEEITNLNLNAVKAAEVFENVAFEISVTWGSRIEYSIDFGDDDTTSEITSELTIIVYHSFDHPATYRVSIQASNLVNPTFVKAIDVLIQYPVKAFEVKTPYLNLLDLNAEGMPSHIDVSVNVYKDPQIQEPTDPYFSLDFDDGTVMCPTKQMCRLEDASTYGVVDPYSGSMETRHILRVQNNYTIPSNYTVKLTVWNNVSHSVSEYDMWVFEGVKELEEYIQFTDVHLAVNNTYDNTSIHELFEDLYVPLDKAVVVSTAILSGTEVLYTWNFNDITKPESTYIMATHDPIAYYKYTIPGSYLITVNASNLVSNSYSEQKIFVHEIVSGLNLTGFGPILINLTVPFVLDLGRVATDACYRIDFICDISLPGRVRFLGSRAMCESRYAEELINNPLFTNIDSEKLWNDVHHMNGSSTIDITNEFYEFNKYLIFYEGFNKVSYINNTLAQIITNYPCYFPTVNVESENNCTYNYQCNNLTNYRQYQASTTIKVQSVVTVNCSSTDLTLYQWKVFKVEGGKESQIILPSYIVTNGSGLGTLVIEPKILTYGVHRFELNVTMLGGEIGLYTLDSTHLEIIPTPLTVEIVAGEYRTVSWDKKVIDADGLALTYDHDVAKDNKTGMNVTWMCRRARSKVNGTVDIEELETFEVWNDDFSKKLQNSTINNEFKYTYPDDAGGCFGIFGGTNIPTPGGILNYTSGNITLNTSSMYWEMEYELKLIVRKGDRRGEFIQILDVVEGEPPVIQMKCKLNCKTKKTPTNRFSLETKETNSRRGVSLYYNWEVWHEQNGTFVKLEGKKVIANSGTGTNVSNLSIEPGLFEENQRYRVVCIASRSAFFFNNGVAHLTFVINDVPIRGTCTVRPMIGEATETEFFVGCNHFVDEDLPLSYTYQYSIDNETNWFTFFNEEYTMMDKGVKLPAGPDALDYLVDIRVRVTDTYGSFVDSNLNITVVPLNCTEAVVVAKTAGLGDYLRMLAGAGQTKEVSNIVSSTSSFLNYCSERLIESETSNTSTIQLEIREDMITTLNILQPAYDMGILRLMASALQLATAYPNELTEHARNVSIHLTSKFARTLQNVDSPLAEDIEESARLVFSSLGVPTKVTAEEDSSATDGIQVISSILDTMSSTMVTGQKNVLVNTDTMSVTVSRSFTEGQENEQSNYEDQDGNQVTKFPKLEDIIGTGNETTRELETRIIVQSNDPFSHGNDTNTLRGSVVSIAMTNDTGQPVYLTDLTNPMEFNIYRGEEQFAATAENVTNDIQYQYNETVGTGRSTVDIVLNGIEMHTAITIEVLSFGEESMIIEDVYTYTIIVYLQVNDTPTEDGSAANCTLVQTLTPIDPGLDYDIEENQSPWNDSVFRREGESICFFSNTVMNMFLSNSPSDVFINVRHELQQGSYGDANETNYIEDDESDIFVPMRYGIAFFASQCYYRSSSDTKWNYDGCEVGVNSTRDTTQCLCSYFAPSEDITDASYQSRFRRSVDEGGSEEEENLITVGGGFSVPMNSIDLGNSAFTKLGENPVVFVFMTCCLCAYFVIIIWARKEDQRDVSRAGVTPMCDNDPRHTYKYEITIFTGVRRDSATTAKVSFILHGEKGDTGIRIVKDKKRPILERSGIDSFLMTVAKPLGTLVHLRIWHDNSGESAKWFLSRVSVKDIKTNRTYYFMLDKWLALEEDDGQIERVIPTAGHSELTSFGHLFHSRTRRNLSDSHLWLSVFMRPPKSNFTRCQRTTCCLSLLFCTMMANILFYGVDVTAGKTAASFSFGPVSFSTAQMVVGIISTLMVFPINMIIVQLFRLSRPRSRKSRCCNSKQNDVKKAKYHRPQRDLLELSTTSKGNSRPASEIGMSPGSEIGMSPGSEIDASPASEIGTAPASEIGTAPASEIGTSRVHIQMTSKPKTKDKRKSSLPLPWWCQYVSWVLAWMTIGVAFWLTIEVAGEFGAEKATEWVTTMAISLIQDIFINQPIKVLLLATFYSLVIKSPDKEDDELTKAQLADDEELLHEQVKEEDLADPLKLEEFNQQRLADVACALPPDRDEIEDQRDVRMKEIKMHEIIKEITAYMVFLFLLMGVAFGNIGKDVFMLRTSMVQTFIEASYNGKMQFTKISSRDYFWNYTNNVFLPSLYAGVSYNGVDDPESASEFLVADRSSSMVTMARLRQLRVQKDGCDVPSPMDTVIDNCRPGYSTGVEETRHFKHQWIPINQTHHEDAVGLEAVWRYQSWLELGSLPYWGKYTLYGGGGYIAELGYTIEDAWEIADYLRSTKWIDQHTRAVFYEFSIFNPPSNLYGVAYMIAEFLPTGGVVPYYNFQAILLDRYSSVNSFIIIMCEVCFGLFILWFLFRELMVFKKKKFQYFKNASNLLEFVVLFLSLMAFVVFVYRYFVVQNLLSKRETNNREYMNFQFYGQLDKLYYYILGLVLFISTIKFLKLLRFNRKMLLLANTIGSCYKELLNFFFMFIIIFASYASAGYMLFITGLKTYSTMIGTLESLFSTLLGKFDFDAMKQTSRILGPFFFFSFILMIVFILMNVFLTIINEAFARTRAEMLQMQNSLEIVDFMYERFKLWTGFSEKRVKRPKKRHTYVEGVEPMQIECDVMNQKLIVMVDKLNEFIRQEKAEIYGIHRQDTQRRIYVT